MATHFRSAPLTWSTFVLPLRNMKVGLIKDQYLDELQEYKTIHCRDRIRGCNIASSVHVTLEEVDVGVFLGQGLKGRRDHMAWTTPIPD